MCHFATICNKVCDLADSASLDQPWNVELWSKPGKLCLIQHQVLQNKTVTIDAVAHMASMQNMRRY